MARGDLYGGIQLDPLTEPPSNLDHADADLAIEKVRDWFFANFEGPEQSTPRDDGEFVYLWGGPWETREIIETIFSSVDHPKEILEAIIEDIENDGDMWVPHGQRIQAPEDDDGLVTSRDPATIYGDLVVRIARLERHLATFPTPPAGIGHNNPPDALESDEDFDADIRQLTSALAIFKAQPPEPPQETQPAIVEAEEAAEKISSQWKRRLAKLMGDTISGAAKEAGKEILKYAVDQNWLHSAIFHLDAVVAFAKEWIAALWSFS